jgi:hypothetical protein
MALIAELKQHDGFQFIESDTRNFDVIKNLQRGSDQAVLLDMGGQRSY